MSCSLSVSATVLQEWKQFWPTWTKPTNTYFSQSTQGLSVHWGKNGKLTSSSSRLDINQLVCGLCASWTCCFRLVTVETTVWNSNCVESNTWPQSLCLSLCQGRPKHPLHSQLISEPTSKAAHGNGTCTCALEHQSTVYVSAARPPRKTTSLPKALKSNHRSARWAGSRMHYAYGHQQNLRFQKGTEKTADSRGDFYKKGHVIVLKKLRRTTDSSCTD